MTTVRAIAHIVLNAPDVPRLAAFYVDVLGFATMAIDRHEATLELGGTRLVLHHVDREPDPQAIPGWSPWFQHCAIAVGDMARAMACLQRASGWSPISRAGPETLPPATGGVTAFKFRDPDGHPLELLDLHEATAIDTPFLRIDHTAVSVVDVDRSIAFYERLGWRVAGRSVNHGIEQARLDDVDDPVVDVVTLRTPTDAAPHVELLAYRGTFDRTTARLDPDAVAATCLVFRADAAGQSAGHDPDGHRFAFV